VTILVPPVVVRDRICRIVAPVPSLLEVEEWTGEWWEPSTLTLREVSSAPMASVEVLRASGIPQDEWGSALTRASAQAIEAMLLADVIERAPLASTDTPPDGMPRVTAEDPAMRRKRLYPGSARFGLAKRRRGTDSPPR
jgi:hypothetical protein